ncbi:MAG: SpoIIE family protein phosphatase [Spirochaetes bacterium]|jgi:serine phosphatase RsbU (regulator of sigma subunit)|nr:SpoIIE family protein phosphatase [Spirochaetota bacterium]
MPDNYENDIISILKNIPILQGLMDDDYRKIIPLLEKRSSSPGELIIKEGAVGDSMYIIINGTVSVTRSGKDGDLVSIQNLYSGTFFGEMSLIDNLPRSANVTAAEPTEFFRLNKKDFDELLEKNTIIANSIYKNFLKETISRFRNSLANFTFSQHILKEKNTILDEINKDLTLAKKLQNYFINTDFLDSEKNMLGSIRHSYIYEPCIEIGGDFLNIIQLDDSSYGIIIADIMGHGITAALATGVIKSAFSIAVRDLGRKPKEIMKFLNSHFLSVMPQLYATCYYSYIDWKNRKITMAKAGHPHPHFYKKKINDFMKIDSVGTGLGLIQNAQFGEAEFELDEGDKILFFTDGIIEQKNRQNEMYAENRIKNKFHELILSDEQKILGSMHSDLKSFSDGLPFEDDITMLLLEF